jgi:hypothetical protein
MILRRLERVRPACLLWCALAPAAHATDPPANPSASATASATRTTPPTAAAEKPAVDRLQLDSTSITGNRELPKVMSIVPWKSAEPPAGPDRPMGSLIDELLAPLDRDEFRREIAYYRDLTTQTGPVSTDPNVPGVSKP